MGRKEDEERERKKWEIYNLASKIAYKVYEGTTEEEQIDRLVTYSMEGSDTAEMLLVIVEGHASNPKLREKARKILRERIQAREFEKRLDSSRFDK